MDNLNEETNLAPGQIWRHYKGEFYQIVCFALLEQTLQPCVVYRASSEDLIYTGETYIRPISEFLEPIAKPVYRFTRIV